MISTVMDVLLAAGEIKGSRRLQKVIYLLWYYDFVPGPLGFGPWLYGPYSPDLAGVVESMTAIGLVEQRGEQTTLGVRRCYKVNKEKARKLGFERLDPPEKVKEAVALINRYQNTDVLELAATILMLERTAGGREGAVKQALEWKSHLKDCLPEAQRLISELEELARRQKKHRTNDMG